jgi:hypothetical protein
VFSARKERIGDLGRKIVAFLRSRATLSLAIDDQTAVETGDATMRIKTLLAAFVLTAVPGFAYAECSWGRAHEVTMSCADGMTWDAASQTCVVTATS